MAELCERGQVSFAEEVNDTVSGIQHTFHWH